MAAMDAADAWNAEQKIKQVLSSLKLTRLDQRMGQPLGRRGQAGGVGLDAVA